jgi:plastocyanin
MTGNQFTPATVDIAATGSAAFRNQDNVLHNVTFNPATPNRPQDVQNLNGGAQGTRRFDTPGVYTYVCTNHPGMTGTVVVH